MKKDENEIVVYHAPNNTLKVRLDKKSTVSIFATVQTKGKR